jgi:hypothetical protein
MRRITLALAASLVAAATMAAQNRPETELLHRPLDQMLDIYVRDGFVYYGAVRAERGRLDRYVNSLNVPAATYNKWTRDGQLAFWLNAYNAFVLQTVANHYPIRGKAGTYPSSSIRQIPGAFEKIRHRAAGRAVTLDEIEKTILPEFKDPRVFLALGRGAIGSGRLRSEAFTTARVQEQLEAVRADFLRHDEMIKIDRVNGVVSVTPIVSWREADFVAAYADKADARFAQRSPVERAILAFVSPRLLPLEQEFIERNQFRVVFHDFDWRLNDLTGGRRD